MEVKLPILRHTGGIFNVLTVKVTKKREVLLRFALPKIGLNLNKTKATSSGTLGLVLPRFSIKYH